MRHCYLCRLPLAAFSSTTEEQETSYAALVLLDTELLSYVAYTIDVS
jgi:hypothetical protein